MITFWRTWMFSAIVIVLFVALGIGAYKYTGKNDSALEQFAEDRIEDHSGIKIDFSPDD